MYKVLEVSKCSAIGDAGVQDALNDEIFGSVFVDDWRWWFLNDPGRVGIGVILFEQGNVEDIVDLHGWRKLEAEGTSANGFDDFERAKSFGIQLAAGAVCLDVLAHQPYFVSWFESRRVHATFVGPECLFLLSFEDVLARLFVDGLEALELLTSRGNSRGFQIEGKPWMVAHVGVEGRHANARVMSGVVGMLGQGEQVCPIGLEVVAEGPEVLLDSLINPFSLAVAFRMKSCGEVWLNVEHLEEGLPPFGGKGRATV